MMMMMTNDNEVCSVDDDYLCNFLPGIYFGPVATAGRKHGPGSNAIVELVKDLDYMMEYLFNSLTSEDYNDLNDVNLVLASTHGMTSLAHTRDINLPHLLHEDYDAMITDAAIASIYTKLGREKEVSNCLYIHSF